MMHTLHKKIYVLAVCLSFLAGCVDAIGFIYLGGYFISFMSGNSTRFAVNLVTGNLAGAALAGMIIALFIAGTVLGLLVRHYSKPSWAITSVLAFVTMALVGAALSYEMGWDIGVIIFMVLAMGAENAVLQRGGDVVIGVTYMTGTLVKIGQRIAHALLGGAKFTWVPYVLLWLGLIVGGATGAWLFHAFGLRSLWVAVLWAGSLMLIAQLLRHRTGELG